MFGCWKHGGEYPQAIVSLVSTGESPYDGVYCAQLGEPVACISHTEGIAWMSQDFAVPAGVASADLTFAYRVFSNDMKDWAWFGVEVQSLTGTRQIEILREGQTPPDRRPKCNFDLYAGWRVFTYNLSNWAGEVVRVRFLIRDVAYGSWGIWAYVDGVALHVTSDAQPLATQKP